MSGTIKAGVLQHPDSATPNLTLNDDGSVLVGSGFVIDALLSGQGSPEGAVAATMGYLYTDFQNGHLYIKASGSGTTGWVQIESATTGSGDVNGPSSGTDNALVRFDGTSGKTVQDSGITVDDSNNVTVNAANTIFTRGNGVGYVLDVLNGAAGATRGMYFWSNGSNRWAFGASATAESGSNAGSDYFLNAYDDAGNSLGARLSINRATGKTTLGSVGATAGLELGSSGPRIMSGTGSPEGVVTAPVGSRWIRTDGATLGDFEYQKRSGTGSTGWVVADGDTGWRLLDATAFAVDTGKFTLTECKLRRAGATVHLHMAGTKVGTTGGAIATVPSGFRVADADTLYQPVFNFTAKTFPAAGNVQVSGSVYWDGSLANAAVYTFTAVWLTNDAWPSSLPGSAA